MNKFLPSPKSVLDFGFLSLVKAKVNALLNCTITDKDGGVVGEMLPSDGNTVYKLNVNFGRWQKPYKELNPDVPVAKGTWVYISPNNDLVTTGMTDPIAGAGTKAYPGIWEAAQDVPASTGIDDYNVPQTDYPGATGTPSGTPLKGDLDGANVYWILICPTCGL